MSLSTKIRKAKDMKDNTMHTQYTIEQAKERVSLYLQDPNTIINTYEIVDGETLKFDFFNNSLMMQELNNVEIPRYGEDYETTILLDTIIDSKESDLGMYENDLILTLIKTYQDQITINML